MGNERKINENSISVERTGKHESEEKLGNIVWHIENNRGIIGDTKVLDQVLESLKGIESELPKDTAEVGQLISTGFMNGIRAQAGAPITVNESLRRIKYGEYNGHHQWDLAKDFSDV